MLFHTKWAPNCTQILVSANLGKDRTLYWWNKDYENLTFTIYYQNAFARCLGIPRYYITTI